MKPAVLTLAAALAGSAVVAAPSPIDRRALVDRHRPVLRAIDPESPLSVGNGELAFTADATGLQTFAEAYEGTIPLGTLSQWGWHTVVAVRVVSPLVARGRIAVRLRFPYGTGGATAADWTRPEAHETALVRSGPGGADLARRLDDDRYDVRLAWAPDGRLTEESRHAFLLESSGESEGFEAAVAFSPAPLAEPLPSFEETRRATREHWNRFWSTGGAVDLSESRDPRWRELERRIVLSQYLTAIQCTGRYPPQETGLTFNSWEGKFHLEMHWWHAAHFALWNRLELLERSLGYYGSILPRATARRQGYSGARWPKMTSPGGAESPSSIGPFLVWQQPHPIYYAELVHRERGDRATLERFRDVVFETAEFMASFAWLPGPGVDPATMRRTLDWIWAHWSWPDTWGWDYPLVAMSAARLGQPQRAIDALLLDTPKNRYRPNGHNHQRPGLTIYLPGNGGLLAAVAMMAAGWDGAPAGDAPGFPRDGSFTVRWEGLRRMP